MRNKILNNLLKRNFTSKPTVTSERKVNSQDLNLDSSAADGIKADMIGPADSVSNLRPILRHKSSSESHLETLLRQKQIETQTWNQEFWSQHNSKFFKEREKFISLKMVESTDNRSPSPDEMSVFYKAFLDKNWRSHIDYNIQWYRRNFTLLILVCRVNLNKLLRRKF